MDDPRDTAANWPAWRHTVDPKAMTCEVDIGDPGESLLRALGLTLGEDECAITVTVPIHWEVCDTCRGRGRHVDPNVDRHGITEEERDRYWSHDDWEDYKSGGYDVTCFGCNGRTTVPVMDRSRMKKELVQHLDREAGIEAAYEAECRAERRYLYGF